MTSREETAQAKGEGEEEGTIGLTATCLCKAQHFRTHVPRTSLPLSAIYCHCTSCRRATGALYSTYVPWPGPGSSIHASSLRRYTFSASASVTTLACSVCGTTVFAETAAEDGSPRYGVQTGCLANIAGIEVGGTAADGNGDGGVAGGSLINITHHVFVGDTQDGGATPWLCDTNSDGSRPRLWRGHRGGEELPYHWPLPFAQAESSKTGDDKAKETEEDEDEEIPIRCHCGGVNLVLRHPTAAFANTARSELPWFIDPTSHKSLGTFDACDSCRLSSGVDIFHWTFALLRHLSFPPPKFTSAVNSSSTTTPTPSFPTSSIELKKAIATPPPNRDPRWGTLTFYSSSPDVQRYFCSRCSAAVFYASDDRPELVDVALGVLDSKRGSRAEDVVSWDFGGKVGWRQDVVGGWREGFVDRVEAAADRWRIERGYPKNWRRIQKEEAAAEG
ncbi:Mss4-like protein [Xylaria sp. FL0933]|nr:Mss4-like protein [Xylaria sp. FL0933]